jgi:hypothetical protein
MTIVTISKLLCVELKKIPELSDIVEYDVIGTTVERFRFNQCDQFFQGKLPHPVS